MAQRRNRLYPALLAVLSFSPLSTALHASPAEGMASYYGDRFNGRRTASGTRFDNDALTAAHRSLEFGTRVRVTNRANGRSVEVVINDRGPHTRNRTIDLSKGAAREIGMLGAGVARVELEVLYGGLRAAPRLAANDRLEPDQQLMMELF